MLTLSAIIISISVFMILIFMRKSKTIISRVDDFNKIGTAIALCIAAAWMLVQDRDATRINIEQSYDTVRQGDRINLFMTVKVKNDGDVPVPINKSSFAVFIDQTFPVGNAKITESNKIYEKDKGEKTSPVARIRNAQTVSVLLSEGHAKINDEEINNIIKNSLTPEDKKEFYFNDNMSKLDEEIQPSADSVYIFWTTLPCNGAAVYVARFELEAKRSWYRNAWLYFANGLKAPDRFYSRHQALINLVEKCAAQPVAKEIASGGRPTTGGRLKAGHVRRRAG